MGQCIPSLYFRAFSIGSKTSMWGRYLPAGVSLYSVYCTLSQSMVLQENVRAGSGGSSMLPKSENMSRGRRLMQRGSWCVSMYTCDVDGTSIFSVVCPGLIDFCCGVVASIYSLIQNQLTQRKTRVPAVPSAPTVSRTVSVQMTQAPTYAEAY
jgi:hypothetical protein